MFQIKDFLTKMKHDILTAHQHILLDGWLYDCQSNIVIHP